MKISGRMEVFGGVSHLEKLLFTKHLSVMVRSGIPLLESIETLISQTKSPTFRGILEAVHSGVKNGQALALTLGRYPKVFDSFYLSMVRVGEESGTLEESLDFLARQLAKENALRNKVRGAMMYPMLLLSAVGIMGGFIALFVLPQLVKFFEAFNVALPVATRILLFVANLMKDYGVLIVGGTVVLAFGLIAVLNSPPVKPYWHIIQLKLPLFGPFFVSVNLANMARNLGVLLKTGVPVTRSLEVTAETLDNLKFKRDLLEVSQKLSRGKNISAAMSNPSYFEFPSIVSKMIGVGEKTGQLEETLLYLSEFYEDDIDNFTKNLTTVLEPFLLIGIGLVVGFVALAIISPIYELTGSIGR